MNQQPAHSFGYSRLLAIGPLPPPVGGASVSFKVFCDLIEEHALLERLDVINSSASYYKPRSHIMTAEGILRAARIALELTRRIRHTERVVIFGPNGFMLAAAPALVFISHLARNPCYLRPYGGSLDAYYAALPGVLRRLLLRTLKASSGVLVETRVVCDNLAKLLGPEHVCLIPGSRWVDKTLPAPEATYPGQPENLRLVYAGHVKETKGIFVLCEALRRIAQQGSQHIQCDLYGPVEESDRQLLEKQMGTLPWVRYRGVLLPEQVVPTLRTYDALVFPSYYPNEGPAGILMEAMIAGIAVIATNYRAIPDLVQDRVNGLLVPTRDPEALACAIAELHADRQLLATLARNNYARRLEYRAEVLIPRMLAFMD